MRAIFTRGYRGAPWFCWLARGSALAVTISALIGAPSGAMAATAPVPLGTAASYAVLAGSTITNTGPTTISGDLGLSPGTSVTGFPPGQVNGTVHVADSAAVQAQADLTTAYDNAAARTVSATIPVELGGTTQTPGVYDSAAGTFGITGTLTLDAQGDPNAVFIFEAASTLITASGSSVSLINGAQASNVFWVVGSSATLGTSSTLQGSILALTSITVTAGATIDGRALARNGAVTLDTNTVNLSEGALTLTSPSSLSWATTLTGRDQSVVDMTPGDQQYTVDDATGSGAGWRVQVSVTTFTDGSRTFPNNGTFVMNGSVTSSTATTAPTATCTDTCTLPVNTTTYPVAITTDPNNPTPFVIYDTAANTGLGQIVIGGSTQPDPVGWWVNVPANALAGTYTSTITMETISGP
jgi:Ice-binding-like/WxL domain surface cell wall-binding